MKDGKLDMKKVGDLPFTFQNGGAVEKMENFMYIQVNKLDKLLINSTLMI